MTRSIADENPRADVAQRMEARGYCPLLLISGGKNPVDNGWQEGPPSKVASRLRWNPDRNLGWRMGVQTNGKRLLAVDDDGGFIALCDVLGFPPATWTQRTPSGGQHFVYRVPTEIKLSNRVRVAGHAVDVRCDGGFIVIAPSELDGRELRGKRQTPGHYRITNQGPLVDLPERWLAALRHVDPPAPPPLPDRLEPSLERALRYTAQCEPAVSGQGGHNATFRVALKAVEFGLSIMDTITVLQEFNRRCDPPWTADELRHKAEQAHGVGRVQRGGKLAGRAARERQAR